MNVKCLLKVISTPFSHQIFAPKAESIDLEINPTVLLIESSFRMMMRCISLSLGSKQWVNRTKHDSHFRGEGSIRLNDVQI